MTEITLPFGKLLDNHSAVNMPWAEGKVWVV